MVVANDIANTILDWYVRGAAFAQTIQDKPLLGWLKQGQKTFPAGNTNVSEPVKGIYMNQTAGFFAGYSQDTSVTFTQSMNVQRAYYPWKEVHAGLIITWTELKQSGITIGDNQSIKSHPDAMAVLTNLLEDRTADYSESWARSMNSMLWNDGTQDSAQVPGLLSLFPLNNTTSTVGGISMATYPFWQHRVKTGITPSAQNSTLIETLRSELVQLTRYGGKPNKALCGSEFLNGLRTEINGKGSYTMTGFDKPTSIGMGTISLPQIGEFVYDPTMDDQGMSKECWVMDGRRTRLRPMQDEDNKTLTPARPYQYMVFLKSMTWTGALESIQQNANERFVLS